MKADIGKVILEPRTSKIYYQVGKLFYPFTRKQFRTLLAVIFVYDNAIEEQNTKY